MFLKTQYGHFKYQMIFFGLFKALASFQRYINKISAKKLNVFLIIYPKNIVIYTNDFKQAHINRIQWVVDFPRKNSLFANLKQSRFYKNEIRFLGYIVSG